MRNGMVRKKAVIVKGNPRFIRGNQEARRFYLKLAAFLRCLDYLPAFDRGEDLTLPDGATSTWIGHSCGAGRLRFAPAHVSVQALDSLDPGAINHPEDDVFTSFHLTGDLPPHAHYVLTDEMREAIATLNREDA
jgi:hypothetical protein